MWHWLAKNFRTFLWALAMAVSVWIAAVTSADPDEARPFPNPIPINIVGQDPGLVISADIPKEMEVTLRAPHSVWEQLNANPQSVRAVLDISGLSAGEHSVNLQIQVDERPVRIVSAGPSSVTFTLEPLVTKRLDVELSIKGQPAIGYQAGESKLEPVQVVISGAQSQVQTVKRARVTINLDGLRESLDQPYKVELVDENNQALKKLTVTPENIQLIIPISQQGGYRDMAVKVIVRGQVASGYRLSNISVFPPVITVFATDPQIVNALPGVVETQPLDLQKASDDISTRLELNLPAGVSVVGEQTVLIQAGISPIESSLTLSGEIVELAGLPANWNAQVSPATIDVIVSGPLPLLDTLTRQDVHVTIDVTGLAEGTHQLEPKVEILISDVIVESILPGTVEVVLVSNTTLTPTPKP
ncbi:MAG: CdaR family protein [Anaerolineales bacterium]|nr:CdaR family protein [Anaerolineales bacterium]